MAQLRYDHPRWRRIRRHQLREHPYCVTCQRRGLAVLATICDHVEPHYGNVNKFWCGALQSLCKTCHDSDKRTVERSGKVRPWFDESGNPIEIEYFAASR